VELFASGGKKLRTYATNWVSQPANASCITISPEAFRKTKPHEMRWPSIFNPDLEDDRPIAAAMLLTVGGRF